MHILFVHAERYDPILDPPRNCNDSVGATNDLTLHSLSRRGQRKLLVTGLLAAKRVIYFEHERNPMPARQFDPSPTEERIAFVQHIRLLTLNNRGALGLQPEVVGHRPQIALQLLVLDDGLLLDQAPTQRIQAAGLKMIKPRLDTCGRTFSEGRANYENIVARIH